MAETNQTNDINTEKQETSLDKPLDKSLDKQTNVSIDVSIDIDMITCPISKLIYKNPVLAMDGHVYEEIAIEEWFRTKNTSPLTNKEISTLLIPEYKIKQLADTICEKYPHLKKERSSNNHIDNREIVKLLINQGVYEKLLKFKEFYYREMDADHLIKFIKNSPLDVMKYFIQNCNDRDLHNKNNVWNLYCYILVYRPICELLFEWVLDNIDLTKAIVPLDDQYWHTTKLTFRYSSKSCILKIIQKYKGSLQGSMLYEDKEKTNICKTMNDNPKLDKSDVTEIIQCILEIYNGWIF